MRTELGATLNLLMKTEGVGRDLGPEPCRDEQSEDAVAGSGISLGNCLGSTPTHRYLDDGDPRVLLQVALTRLRSQKTLGAGVATLPSLSLKSKGNKTPFGQLAMINATSCTFQDEIYAKITKSGSLLKGIAICKSVQTWETGLKIVTFILEDLTHSHSFWQMRSTGLIVRATP